ncbi:hypothetical protein Tco_0419214 [Tanacetum coccineum]
MHHHRGHHHFYPYRYLLHHPLCIYSLRTVEQTDPRYEVGESSSAPTARPTGGFRADYGFVATIDREIMRDLERDVGYGITDTWDEMLVDMPGAPATDDTEMGRRMIEFTTRVRQDTNEIYTRLADEQTKRQLMAGRLNMLYRDRRHFARECRSKRNQESRRRDAGNTRYKAKDNGRRPGKQEEPKALVTLDGKVVDWLVMQRHETR